MRSTWWTFFVGAALLFAPYAIAEQPRLADGVNFDVPLTGGQVGGAILLPAKDGQFLVVAVQGSPPILLTYRVEPNFGPRPEPGPQPEPGPGPQPEPQPQPQGPLSLIWIEETLNRTPGQAAAITAKDIRDALKAAGWTLRVADVDVVDEAGQVPAELRPYIEAARSGGLPRLFAIDSKGAEVFAGKAPANADEFKALLSKLGLKVAESQQSASNCPNGKCPTSSAPRTRVRLFR